MQGISPFVAFISGLVSFFAPCVVPLLPAYIAYISGVSVKELSRESGMRRYRRQVFLSSLFYVLGFSLVFVILGTTAASLGFLLRYYDVWIERVGGLLVMIFALGFLRVL